MSQITAFKIAVSSDLPDYERGMLVTTLEDVAIVQTPEDRVFGIDDYIVIVTAIGATAATAKEIGELIEKIIDWRRSIRKKSIESVVELQSSEKEPLDLRTATDEEIREWFKL